MATTSYKCLSCGAAIHYKPELQKFKCDYCFSEYTEEELSEQSKTSQPPTQKLNSYHCDSCGAQVVTDDTTTSTFCYYCHNPVVISDRLDGEFLPNKMIPFSVDKKRAEEFFLDWTKGKKLVPTDFTSSSQLEKITGIYIPYWWADYGADIDYIGEGSSIRVWQSSGREYTETKKYEIIRKGQIDINNVAEVAFNKIDKNLLNGIGPYNEQEAIPFSMPYLSGFFAEQYNITKDQVAPELENQVNNYYNYLMSETIGGFDQVKNIKNEIDIDLKKWSYTLLPAWILTYLYNDKTYIFAVNGQTGKSFGELPLSKKKVSLGFGMIFMITAIILLLGGLLIW